MYRRDLLKVAASASLISAPLDAVIAAVPAVEAAPATKFTRVRPGDAGWPSEQAWNSLGNAVGNRLVKLDDPLAACREDPGSPACQALLKEIRDPYFISDDPALTETSGWLDAWTWRPSTYAVKVRTTEDVVATVNFARTHNLRLVVKGGGHSYQGTSDSADSLMIWTREMNAITIRDAFVPRGCEATHAPQPAVTVETGARWYPVYEAVTTRGGRYVQGGGCATVGVAGFIHGGGFGSFSKQYGLGAAALLEAEIVTADGAVLLVNACNHPDLFWAVKGGGGGSFGVLTKLTLATRELPTVFGRVYVRIRATSDTAFRDLVSKTMRLYAERLFNPTWGEEISFGADNAVTVSVSFQGIEQSEAEEIWKPFVAALTDAPKDFVVEAPLEVIAMPARHYWDHEYVLKHFPGHLVRDDRPGAPSSNVFSSGDAAQVGVFIYGYTSGWLPASLLTAEQIPKLVDALFAATRAYSVTFHFNKGLAGAPKEEIEAARDTAMNPAVLDAFALFIIAGGGPPSFPGIAGHEPDLALARKDARAIREATEALLKIAPDAGSYLSEADYFDTDWKHASWGPHFDRLATVKKRYDPDGLFFAHHGVGSDEWSADGFTRL
jgi:FAD/FMN-containing dehydrogenase